MLLRLASFTALPMNRRNCDTREYQVASFESSQVVEPVLSTPTIVLLMTSGLPLSPCAQMPHVAKYRCQNSYHPRYEQIVYSTHSTGSAYLSIVAYYTATELFVSVEFVFGRFGVANAFVENSNFGVS